MMSTYLDRDRQQLICTLLGEYDEAQRGDGAIIVFGGVFALQAGGFFLPIFFTSVSCCHVASVSC